MQGLLLVQSRQRPTPPDGTADELEIPRPQKFIVWSSISAAEEIENSHLGKGETMKNLPDGVGFEKNIQPDLLEVQPGTRGKIDLEGLRLSQDFHSIIGVKKALLTVPVKKPDRQWFVRTHPDTAFQLTTAVLELKEEQEIYLLSKDLWTELPGEIIPKIFFTSINRQGVVFLWPIRLPGEEGNIDDWNRSALEAAEMARSGWIRLAANRSLGAYDVFEATGDLPEPEWNLTEFQDLVNTAFKGRYIEDLEHPVLRRLRGEI
ncbi:MAG: hypothetical protein O2954_06840 [bacterium]|nr:hypothetical protein [bacterium]